MLIYLWQYENGLLFCLSYRLSKVKLDVAIKPIPTIPTTVAMPVVFSPRISPSNIKNAAVNARISPIIHMCKECLLIPDDRLL